MYKQTSIWTEPKGKLFRFGTDPPPACTVLPSFCKKEICISLLSSQIRDNVSFNEGSDFTTDRLFAVQTEFCLGN